MAGDRGKMSSFPDPLELERVDGQWEEVDPAVFERVTAVPGEVAAVAPPDGTAGSNDDAVSGLHERATPDAAVPTFREPVPDDDLPPVLGSSRTSGRPRAASKESDPRQTTGIRRSSAPRPPVLELELEDIGSLPPPPERRPDALEMPLPERPAVPMSSPLPEPSVPPEVLDMRGRYATGDFTGALVVAESLLEATPGHEEARRCHDRCTSELSQMYLARLGSPSQAARVVVPNDQIRWLSLDHRAGFLLSLIDGHLTIEELLDISGMPRLDALRILYGLLDQRVIALCDRS